VVQNARKLFSGRGRAPDPTGGAYSSPDPLAGGKGDLLPPLQHPPLLSALRGSPLLLLQNCAPQCPHLMQASDAPESHIGYDLKLVFSCKVGVYCFCIQVLGLVFGYISTVVISVLLL